MTTMAELFAEEEERLLAQTRKENEAEDEFWKSLTPYQQADFFKKREAYLSRFDDIEAEITN